VRPPVTEGEIKQDNDSCEQSKIHRAVS
jgi:hypothetical protein